MRRVASGCVRLCLFFYDDITEGCILYITESCQTRPDSGAFDLQEKLKRAWVDAARQSGDPIQGDPQRSRRILSFEEQISGLFEQLELLDREFHALVSDLHPFLRPDPTVPAENVEGSGERMDCRERSEMEKAVLRVSLYLQALQAGVSRVRSRLG